MPVIELLRGMTAQVLNFLSPLPSSTIPPCAGGKSILMCDDDLLTSLASGRPVASIMCLCACMHARVYVALAKPGEFPRLDTAEKGTDIALISQYHAGVPGERDLHYPGCFSDPLPTFAPRIHSRLKRRETVEVLNPRRREEGGGLRHTAMNIRPASCKRRKTGSQCGEALRV